MLKDADTAQQLRQEQKENDRMFEAVERISKEDVVRGNIFRNALIQKVQTRDVAKALDPALVEPEFRHILDQLKDIDKVIRDLENKYPNSSNPERPD